MEKVMSESSGKAREINLGDDFGDVVINANGAQVTISASGSIHGFPTPANDSDAKGKTAPEIPLRPTGSGGQVGDEMPDGTIYAGVSPDTGKPFYTTPRDEKLTVTFRETAGQAMMLSRANALGHHDWRVPSKGELNTLWENRPKGKLAGTFNESGSNPGGWYWASSQDYGYSAWSQRFSDGSLYNCKLKFVVSSLRCVRG
jgi:hypothetical protein